MSGKIKQASTKINAQDDDREILVAQFCGLIRSEKRQGSGIPDAVDVSGNRYELKSGTTHKSINVLNLNLNIINRYRQMYFIFSQGDYVLDKNNNKNYIMSELWVAHPSNLEWFFSKHETWLADRLDLLSELNTLANNNNVMNPYKQKLLDSIKSSLVDKGPSMNMNKIRASSTRLDHVDSNAATQQLKQFVDKNPIHFYKKITTVDIWKDFLVASP